MSWTEAQKAQARTELLRRKTSEAAATYRSSCLKALCWSAVCLLLIALTLSDLKRYANWINRVPDLFFIFTATAGLVVTTLLTYVRYLDWRRSAAIATSS